MVVFQPIIIRPPSKEKPKPLGHYQPVTIEPDDCNVTPTPERHGGDAITYQPTILYPAASAEVGKNHYEPVGIDPIDPDTAALHQAAEKQEEPVSHFQPVLVEPDAVNHDQAASSNFQETAQERWKLSLDVAFPSEAWNEEWRQMDWQVWRRLTAAGKRRF